jgi:hypothetical protein
MAKYNVHKSPGWPAAAQQQRIHYSNSQRICCRLELTAGWPKLKISSLCIYKSSWVFGLGAKSQKFHDFTTEIFNDDDQVKNKFEKNF